MMQSPAEAQDVVADTVEKMWRMRDRLGELDNPQGYVVKSVRTTALDALRARNRRGSTLELEDVPSLTLDSSLSPVERIERVSELELVKDMMKLLPDNQRRVLELSAFRGLDVAEVVQVTGFSEGNVRVLLTRARSKLRKAFRQFYK